MIFPLVLPHILPAISFLCCFLLAAAEQWASIKIILVWKCSKKLKNLLPILALGMLKVKVLVTQLCLTLCDPMVFHGTPGMNTGVGCYFLLQGVFLIQGWNPGILHCRWILYCLSHLASLPYVYYLKENSLIRKIAHINLFSTIRGLLWIEICN